MKKIPVQTPATSVVGQQNVGSQNNNGKAFYTPRQAAVRWNFHPESVRRLIRKGSVAAVLLGRRVLIPAAEIERLEYEGRILRCN